jgi:hypothetical protein
MEESIINVNGKKVVIPRDATVRDARDALGAAVGNELFLADGTKPLGESDVLHNGETVWTVPPRIVKGQATTSLVGGSRLAREIELLRSAVGTRSTVVVGQKSVGSVTYDGVLVKNVALDSRKFGVSKTDILFLLPPDYPALPPIGCYLNYPWETAVDADRHFTMRAYYGAPFLGDEGWYWYCVGLGGGFDASAWQQSWKPAADPADGQNLARLFVAARLALNSD